MVPIWLPSLFALVSFGEDYLLVYRVKTCSWSVQPSCADYLFSQKWQACSINHFKTQLWNHSKCCYSVWLWVCWASAVVNLINALSTLFLIVKTVLLCIKLYADAMVRRIKILVKQNVRVSRHLHTVNALISQCFRRLHWCSKTMHTSSILLENCIISALLRYCRWNSDLVKTQSKSYEFLKSFSQHWFISRP